MRHNQLTTLPDKVFSGLTALGSLNLGYNNLSSLPEGVFSGLTALWEIHVYNNNNLSSLPEGVFSGLTALRTINLGINKLTSLPPSVFSGLSSLRRLWLGSREPPLIPVPVSLEKVGEDQFKATMHTGAPFEIVLPLSIANGSISSGTSTIMIPIGSVESETLTVTRTPGTTFAVTVDIGTFPELPEGEHLGYTLVKSDDLPLEMFSSLAGAPTPVCDRTAQVRDAIVAAGSGVSNCRNVTEAHLAEIDSLELYSKSISALKVGDFSGLTALIHLNLNDNQLSSLPAGIFAGLNELRLLAIGFNQLSSLPDGIFDDLTKLTVFEMVDTPLSNLPAGIFDGLNELILLGLNDNQLSSLPDGIFNDLTKLTTLRLQNNRLSSLPDGIFDGLTKLISLNLSGNSVDPLLVTMSLEKVGADQVKAVVPIGAPFEIILPLSVTNGTIDGGATTITIPAGSVESAPLTVTRTSGTTAAVTVDIGTLSRSRVRGRGYALVKSADLPLEVISEATSQQTATDFNGDGKTDFVDFFLFADAYGGTDARFDLDGSGTVDFVDFFQFVDAFDQAGQAKLLAMAQEMIGLPAETQLQQNAPNPFNSETVVSWFLLEPGFSRVEVFALTGQRVAVLHQGPLQAGFHRIHWDGRDDAGRLLASGVYLYRLVSADRVLTRKLTLLR